MDQIKWPKFNQPMSAAAMAAIKAKQSTPHQSAEEGNPAAKALELELQESQSLLKAEDEYHTSYSRLEDTLEQIKQQEQKVLYAEPATNSKNLWLGVLTALNLFGLFFVVGGSRGWPPPLQNTSEKTAAIIDREVVVDGCFERLSNQD
ncbi:MAG: hypothetical protein KGS72_13460 [Cyanobacteria bacterium REEB67]|nr:hypothetical protein [Cyanobacteria bacterium REEB67]